MRALRSSPETILYSKTEPTGMDEPRNDVMVSLAFSIDRRRMYSMYVCMLNAYVFAFDSVHGMSVSFFGYPYIPSN